MSDSKCCKNCVFFNAGGMFDGLCDYPAPEWIEMTATASRTISMPEFVGEHCRTYKNRMEAVSESTPSEYRRVVESGEGEG